MTSPEPAEGECPVPSRDVYAIGWDLVTGEVLMTVDKMPIPGVRFALVQAKTSPPSGVPYDGPDANLSVTVDDSSVSVDN